MKRYDVVIIAVDNETGEAQTFEVAADHSWDIAALICDVGRTIEDEGIHGD